MNVTEIFYSLQGEGGRAGEASIFIRLSGCSTRFACAQRGIICDTEFESGREMSLEQIDEWCRSHAPQCRWIIWTGGEPTDQLTPEIVAYFKHRGYLQAIETSGVRSVPVGLDYVTISPKVAEHILKKNFPAGVDELRYVRHIGQDIPQPSVAAKGLFLSPHSDGASINGINLGHCIRLCQENPSWRLSIQQHKVWGVL